jgi:hypothetical protein
MRGDSFEYLIVWAEIVAIFTVCLWGSILLMKFLISKLKAKGGNGYTVARKIL